MSDLNVYDLKGRLSPEEERRAEAAWRERFEAEQEQKVADLKEWQEGKKEAKRAVYLMQADVAPMVPLGSLLATEVDKLKELRDSAKTLEHLRLADAAASFECQACQDTGNLHRWNDKTKRSELYPCKYCAANRAEKARVRLAQEVNHRWPIDGYALAISKQEWDDNREGATEATREARRLADEVMGQMPSSTTLFLIGEATEVHGALYGVGTGKTRLLAEIALAARGKGLSAILATAERIRSHLHNYPQKWEPEELQEEKSKKLALVDYHLKNCEVLCIDEMGWEQGQAFEVWLLELLNHRIAAGKTTCLATNMPGRAILPVLSRLQASSNLWVDLSGDRDARQA